MTRAIPTVDEVDAMERATESLARLVAEARPAARPEPRPVESRPLPELAVADALLPEYLDGLRLAGRPVLSLAERVAEADAVRQASEARSAAVRENAARMAATYGPAQTLGSIR